MNTYQLTEVLLDLLDKEQKIEAIKTFRREKNCSLRKAKNHVEFLQANGYLETFTSEPTRTITARAANYVRLTYGTQTLEICGLRADAAKEIQDMLNNPANFYS